MLFPVARTVYPRENNYYWAPLCQSRHPLLIRFSSGTIRIVLRITEGIIDCVVRTHMRD